MAEHLYGPDDPEVALADSELAVEFFLRSDVVSATTALENALNALVTQPQRYENRIDIIRSNLAVLALETENGVKALRALEPLAKKMIASEEESVRRDGISVLNNLAQAQMLVGRPDLALETNRRGQALAIEIGGLHLNPTLLTNQPLYLGALGQTSASLRSARKGLTLLAQMEGSEPARARAHLLASLSVILENQGRHDEAYDAGQQAIDLMRDLVGPDAPINARIQRSLLGVLYAQGAYDAVLALSVDIITSLKNQGDPLNGGLIEVQEIAARARYDKDPSPDNLAALAEVLRRWLDRDQKLLGDQHLGWLSYARKQAELNGPQAALETITMLERLETEGRADPGSARGLMAAQKGLWSASLDSAEALANALPYAELLQREYAERLLTSGLEARLDSKDRVLLADLIQASLLLGMEDQAFELSKQYLYSGTNLARSRQKIKTNAKGRALQELLLERQQLTAELSLYNRQIEAFAKDGSGEETAALATTISEKQARLDRLLRTLSSR